MNLTGQQIFDALLRDPSFTSQVQSDEGRVVWRDLCEVIPEALSEFLAQTVSVTSVFNAKLAILKKISEGDWVDRIVNSLKNDLIDASELTFMFKDMLSRLIVVIPEIVGDVSVFLSSQGIDEETFLGHPNGGQFTEATMTRWKQGNFIVAELLATQPGSIIMNG